MLRSLLLALDDTPGAAAARDLAFALARDGGASVSGVFVLDRPHEHRHEPVPPGAGAFAARRDAARIAAVEAECDAVLATAREAAGGQPFEIVRREEDPETALLLEGAAHDLVVVGRDSTLGHESCEDGLSPTVEALIRDGVRPLLVVPPRPLPDAAGAVLIGYDGSRAAMRTVQLFALLGLGGTRPVRLLGFGPGAARLDALAAYLARHRCDVTAEAAEGDAQERLIEEAARLPAAMLVLGAESETGLARLIFGSATARLLRAAPCPVFIHG
jgi:nucleotide-binding universal stress UspA family protein